MILFFFVFSTLVASPEVFYFGRRRAVPIFLQPLSAVVEYVGAWRRARWLFFKPWRAWEARKRAFERMGWAFDPEAQINFGKRGVSFSGGVTLQPCKCPWHVARREWNKTRAFAAKNWKPILAVAAVIILLPVVGFYSVGMLGAAFTSKASGNWTAVGQTTWNEVGAPGAGDNATIQAGHTVTLDASSPCTNYTVAATGVLALGAFALTHSGTASVSGGVTVTTGGTVENGAVTVNSGGAYGSNTAWVRDQNALFTASAGSTVNMPNGSGTWNCSNSCSISGTFNHDNGTYTYDGTGGHGIQQSTTTVTFNNITKTGGGVLDILQGAGASQINIQGNILNSAGTIRLCGGTGNKTYVLGSASNATTFTNNATVNLDFSAGHTNTIQAASSAFPWTLAGTIWAFDANASTLILSDGVITPAWTTGATAAYTITAQSMTFSGALTVSSGDTFIATNSAFLGAITVNGSMISDHHSTTARNSFSNETHIWGAYTFAASKTYVNTRFTKEAGANITVAVSVVLTLERTRVGVNKIASVANAMTYLVDTNNGTIVASWPGNPRGSLLLNDMGR